MKKVIAITLLLVLIMSCCLLGCTPKEKEEETGEGNGGDCESPWMGTQIILTSDKTEFDIDDVTLTFYVGSDFAGEDATKSFRDFPTVTYLYFTTTNVRNLKPSSEYIMENYYNIETLDRINIYKKFLYTDEDNFYRKNTFKNIQKDDPIIEEIENSALHKVSMPRHYPLEIPDISYQITIPAEWFSEEEGVITFEMKSYFIEDFAPESLYYWYPRGYKGPEDLQRSAGDELDAAYIDLAYERDGRKITLYSDTEAIAKRMMEKFALELREKDEGIGE